MTNAVMLCKIPNIVLLFHIDDIFSTLHLLNPCISDWLLSVLESVYEYDQPQSKIERIYTTERELGIPVNNPDANTIDIGRV